MYPQLLYSISSEIWLFEFLLAECDEKWWYRIKIQMVFISIVLNKFKKIILFQISEQGKNNKIYTTQHCFMTYRMNNICIL